MGFYEFILKEKWTEGWISGWRVKYRCLIPQENRRAYEKTFNDYKAYEKDHPHTLFILNLLDENKDFVKSII